MYTFADMCYITSTYIHWVMHRPGLWLLLVPTFLISHCASAQYTQCVCIGFMMKLLSLYLSSFYVRFPMPSAAFHWWVLEHYTSVCLNHISILSGNLIRLMMALHMNDDHIRYYHLDATQSVGLVWSFFSHPISSSSVCICYQLLYLRQGHVFIVLLSYILGWWATYKRESSEISMWPS